jgi:hypothetical protein
METIRVFINEQPYELPAVSTVEDAVALYDGSVLKSLASGATYVTDGRGIRMERDALVSTGSILRVITSRQRLSEDQRADT